MPAATRSSSRWRGRRLPSVKSAASGASFARSSTGSPERPSVHLPAGGAARDTVFVDELRAVVLPRRALGRDNELQRRIEPLGACEHALELRGIETVPLDELVDEALHLGTLAEGFG